nr:hypothetical protein [Bacillus sp. JCM 19034]
MITKRHFVFNILFIIIPWLSLVFIGKRSLKKHSLASFCIVIFEIINHMYGHKREWWEFYEKEKSFLRDELPFTIGPYMPISMWFLKYSFGNFKKFVFINAIANGLFAFIFINILRKFKIAKLKRLSNFQFFLYLHYKSYILYLIQYLLDKKKTMASS